jgi:WD40 repeat protein
MVKNIIRIFPILFAATISVSAGDDAYRIVFQDANRAAVNCEAFSPDGKYIAAGSEDNRVRLWTRDGFIVKTYGGFGASVESVKYSPDGRRIAAGDFIGNVAFIDTEDDKVVAQVKVKGGTVKGLSFSPDGSVCAAVSNDRQSFYPFSRSDDIPRLSFLSVKGRILSEYIPSAFSRNAICPLPRNDGILLFSVQSDDESGKVCRSFFYFFGYDGVLRRKVECSALSGPGAIRTMPLVSMSEDGRIAVTGRSCLQIYSAEGTLLKESGKEKYSIRDIAFLPGGKSLVAITAVGDFSLFDAVLKKTYSAKLAEFFVYESLGIDQKSGDIALSVKRNMTIFSSDGSARRSFSGENRTRSYVTSVTTSGLGDGIVSVESGKLVKRSVDGELLSFIPFDDRMYFVKYDSVGKFYVIANNAGLTKILDRSFKVLRTFPAPAVRRDFFIDMSLPCDGKRAFFMSYEGRVYSRDLSTGKLSVEREWYKCSTLCVSDNLERAVFRDAANLSIRIVEFKNGLMREIRNIKTEGFLPNRAVFNADASIFAAGGINGEIRFYSIDGKLRKTFTAHDARIEGLSFAGNGNYLLSASEDGTVRLWNVGTGAWIAYSAFNAGTKWLAYSADGYFDSSLNIGDCAAVMRGETPYGLETAALTRNRPDLMLESIGYEDKTLIEHYRRVHEKRLIRRGVQGLDNRASLNRPSVRIVSFEGNDSGGVLKFECDGSGSALRRCNIFVNNVPVFRQPGKVIDGRMYSGSENVPLVPGVNKIEVSCENADGAESYRALLRRESKANGKGDLYYLGIGVSEYREQALNLKYAAKDVRDLGALLSSMKGYHKVNVLTLCDRETDATGFGKAKEFLRASKPGDTVIVSIAGHGCHGGVSGDTYYYLPYGADPYNIAGSCVSFEEIESMIDGIGALNRIVFLDTCQSGESETGDAVDATSKGFVSRSSRAVSILRRKFPSGVRPFDGSTRYIYSDLLRRTGAVVISSSRGDEASYESDATRNGLFSSALMIEIKKAMKSGAKKIELKTLSSRIADSVANMSGGAQHPVIDRDNIYSGAALYP